MGRPRSAASAFLAEFDPRLALGVCGPLAVAAAALLGRGPAVALALAWATAAVMAALAARERGRVRAGATTPQGAAEEDGPPSQAAFLAEVQARLDDAPDACLAVGVFRLEDLDSLAAVDARAARSALDAFAERLARTLGPGQPFGRLEGAAFAVAVPDACDAESARKRLRALAYVLGQEIVRDTLRFTPQLRVGAAIHPADGEDAAELLRGALACACARPEDGGSGPVVFFSPRARAAAVERFSLKQELRGAIDREELSLVYQPVVDLTTGRATAAEALLRWRRPDGTQVPPGRFVPLLEESALVEEVGLWTFNTACRQVRSWSDAGLDDVRVAVNLSARQFGDVHLAQTIARILDMHGVAPGRLEVELTETAAMQDAARTRALLGELHELGVGVAIDDFGSGYSSLSYLKNLPFTKLKIDREFVTDVDTRSDSRAICKALIELTRGLGISVLAEGSERLEEVETLFGLGCPLFQGFYFSRPLDPEAFARQVVDPRWLARLASPVHRRLETLRLDVARAL